MTSGLERYFGVAGSTVVLTGATRGIGLAMTEAFAAAGARLVISSNEQEACHALGKDLQARGVEAVAVTADVRSRADLGALVDAAVQRFHRIDVLICNAGISGPRGSMGDAGDTAFDELLDINLRHPLMLTGRVAPLMAQQGGGSIIVTSSIAGLRGNAHIGLYGITKAALTQLARNLAVEYGPSGVRANAIAPGLIRTSWADNILNSPQATASRLASTPLRRIGEPWEIAAAALFLAGPGSAFITGQTLVVDGGTLISDGN
jgi:NAD(P)-dependent dehydrogenase (short-subunit alcohol dehydrogenase family)